MTIFTHTVDCGQLGEIELTISYIYRSFRSGRGTEPDEPESAVIRWIRIGGENGVDVPVSSGCIADEIIPACVADWTEATRELAVEYAEAVRAERMERRLSA